MADYFTFANFAQTNLTAPLASDSTAISVADTSVFPSGICTAVIWGSEAPSPLKDDKREIVLVISDGAGTLTLVRGMENTTAGEWKIGDNIANVITASVLNSLTKRTYLADNLVSVSNNHEMSVDDLFLAVNFSEGFYPLTITLPQVAICAGKRYSITNISKNIGEYADIVPQTSEIFASVSSGRIPLCAGASCTLTSDGTQWIIAGYTQSGHTDIKVYQSSEPVSAAEGLVYADATDGMVILSLVTDGAQGLPLTVIRKDATSNEVRIEVGMQSVSLHGQGSSITVTTDGGENLTVINRYVPDNATVVTVDSTYLLQGHERHIFADATQSPMAVVPLNASACAGASVTVLKTDASANTIYVSLDGNSGTTTVPLNATDPKGYFVSDGADWHRLY